MTSDNFAYRYPVSIKGVVIIDGKIPILKNERNEFELPGGKLDTHEQPINCVVREIKEELNIAVKVSQIIDSWLYTIRPDVRVVIVTYGCVLSEKPTNMKMSHEHKELMMATLDEINSINMPQGYKDSIKQWFAKNALKVS